MKYHSLTFLWILIWAIFLGCEKKPEIQGNVLSVVGDRQITLDEFRLYYELDPNFGIDSTGYPALREELHKYIDRILTYQKAHKNGLIEDSTFIRARQWEKKQAMLRQLYREVVESRIKITEQELRQLFIKNNIKVRVRHLFSKDSGQVVKWLQQLQAGQKFETLASRAFQDSVLANNGGELGWVELGKLDEDFASAVEQLEAKEISKPVRTRWGYHIIQLLDKEEQAILVENELNRRRPSLRKQIKRKKSREIANQFISEFMGERNPQPDVKTFRRLWQALSPGEREKKELGAPVMFTNHMIDQISQQLKPYAEQPLIHYGGGKITLGEYLSSLKDIPTSNRPRFNTPRQLSNEIGIWVRDKFLIQEAIRRGLQNHPRIKKEVREFVEEQSYLYYWKKETEQINIPDPIKAYFRDKRKNKTILQDHPQLQKFNTLQQWQWWRGQQNLHKKLNKLSIDVEINEKLLRKENSRMDWSGRIPMFIVRRPQ